MISGSIICKRLIVYLVVAMLTSSTLINGIITKDITDEFDYSDYEEFIIRHKSDKVVMPIYSADMALITAELLLYQEYGEMVEELKPFEVYYNTEHDVWLVEGPYVDWSQPVLYLGLSGSCLIEGKTGKVIAMWISK